MKTKRKTRDKILKVAGMLFAQRGYFGTSMRDIAYELNLTKAALYYYFKSKDELCLALLATTAKDLINALSLAWTVGEDSLDKLFKVIKAYLDFATKRPEARLLLDQEFSEIDDKDLKEFATNFEEQILKFLEQTISAIEQTRRWSKRKVVLVASVILGFISRQFLTPSRQTLEASKAILSLIFPSVKESKV